MAILILGPFVLSLLFCKRLKHICKQNLDQTQVSPPLTELLFGPAASAAAQSLDQLSTSVRPHGKYLGVIFVL